MLGPKPGYCSEVVKGTPVSPRFHVSVVSGLTAWVDCVSALLGKLRSTGEMPDDLPWLIDSLPVRIIEVILFLDGLSGQ